MSNIPKVTVNEPRPKAEDRVTIEVSRSMAGALHFLLGKEATENVRKAGYLFATSGLEDEMYVLYQKLNGVWTPECEEAG